jgi:hypothetical protein
LTGAYIADKTALTVRHSSFTLHEHVSAHLKHNKYFFDIPIPFCHNLYLSATLKQFLTEFAARYNCLHHVYMSIKENSGFASPILGRHISTFCGYRILFSIRNPYVNRFTNHFSIHS